MDRIRISDLRLRCILGVSDEERREKQDVSITVVLHADLSKAAASDRFEDAIDYRALKKRIVAIVEGSQFYLLEALTKAVADTCLEPPQVAKVDVRVDKTAALRFARSVAVEMTRERAKTARAFVSVGSNINPEANAKSALALLAEDGPIVGVSTVYLTVPVACPEQAAYYNCVAEVETTLPPHEFKERVLRRIESYLGRRRAADAFAPRTIDLDLIAYDTLQLDAPDLTLPDPEIAARPWLAIGLAEVAPELNLPGMGLAMELASKASCEGLTPLTEYTEKLRKAVIHGA